jgi:aminoglycoside phosphotransferase
VHHIIPYRLTADNGQDNLIPFCLKHHKVAEVAFLEIERAAMADLAGTKISLGSVMRARQEATRLMLQPATLDGRPFDAIAAERA